MPRNGAAAIHPHIQLDVLIRKSGANPGRTIIRSLRKIMQLMDMHSRLLLKQYDLTIPQVMCLYEIYEKGALPVAVLAGSIHMSSSTLIGIIDRLSDKKFVRRSRNAIDRRCVYVNITAKGHEFVTSTPYLLHNRLHDALNNLDSGIQVTIAESLNAIVSLLEAK